ncbi:MAG TPA: membrane assembly protein AsmA, partial [Microscillaceae bacterium]|nr:membrane assembly protein AsmA [Microscillaceae bacterium]
MKLLRGVLITFAVVFLMFFISALTLPYLFKSRIVAMIDREIQQNVNAKITYNKQKFSVNFLSSFPLLSINFGDYVVIGKDTFASDTLAYGQSIGISISYLGV